MSDKVVDQIQAASASDVPKMASPFSGEVPLLRGLHVAETDTWHTVAHVRELNGGDEEALVAKSAEEGITYTEYLSEFLNRAVLRIGDLPARGIIDKMILPDRDVLFLGIVMATYGSEREVVATCNHCGEQQNIIIELDKDFEVRGMGEDFRAPLEVDTPKGLLKFRRPTGEDLIFATKDVDSVPQIDTRLLARCVVTNEDTPIEERIEWARELSIPIRKKVDAVMTAATQDVGPQLGEVETRCAKCNKELNLTMDWVSLLLG